MFVKLLAQATKTEIKSKTNYSVHPFKEEQWNESKLQILTNSENITGEISLREVLPIGGLFNVYVDTRHGTDPASLDIGEIEEAMLKGADADINCKTYLGTAYGLCSHCGRSK